MTLRQSLLTADEISRRGFLGNAAAGVLGVGAMPVLQHAAALAPQDPQDAIRLQPATARRVIYLYMSGGMSHLDTFDPKPGAETMGPSEAIATNADGVQVGSHFTELSRHMDKVAVINSMWSNQGAHSQGRYFMHTSYLLRGTIRHPSLGAWLSRMSGNTNTTLPGHVAVGGDIYSASGGFFESKHFPLPIGDPEEGLQNSHLPPTVTEEVFEP